MANSQFYFHDFLLPLHPPSTSSTSSPLIELLVDLQESGLLTPLTAQPLINLITVAHPSLISLFIRDTLADNLGLVSSNETPLPQLFAISATSRFASVADTIHLGIKAFLTKSGRRTASPIPDNTNNADPPVPQHFKQPLSSRSSKERGRCLQRDRNLCIISSSSNNLEVAHIIPFSIRAALPKDKKQNPHSTVVSSEQLKVYPTLNTFFWDFVTMFLGSANTTQLRSRFNQLDVVENMLLLNCDVHKYFGSGRLALIPHLTPAEELAYDPSTTIEYNVLVDFPQHHSPDPGAPLIMKAPPLPNRNGMVELLLHGNIVKLRTDDPSKCPLPHPSLLGLHAIVSRIIAARGGADMFLDNIDLEYDSLDDMLCEVDSDSHTDSETNECEWVDKWVGGTYREHSPRSSPPPEEGLKAKAEPVRPVGVVMSELGRREIERWAVRECL